MYCWCIYTFCCFLTTPGRHWWGSFCSYYCWPQPTPSGRTFYASPSFFFVNNLHELAQSLYDFVIICLGPPEYMFVVNKALLGGNFLLFYFFQILCTFAFICTSIGMGYKQHANCLPFSCILHNCEKGEAEKKVSGNLRGYIFIFIH
jgi:hypothetical protein